jgi:hypothetical protein
MLERYCAVTGYKVPFPSVTIQVLRRLPDAKSRLSREELAVLPVTGQ